VVGVFLLLSLAVYSMLDCGLLLELPANAAFGKDMGLAHWEAYA
jgi:hypothetical protein